MRNEELPEIEKPKNFPHQDTEASDFDQLEIYEMDYELIQLFLSGRESEIQNFLDHTRVDLERKYNKEGQLKSVKLTDREGKLIWFMDFDWYRKQREESIKNAKIRKEEEITKAAREGMEEERTAQNKTNEALTEKDPRRVN